jgi:hypothetical protein
VIGSPAVAAFIAHATFWALLAGGIISGALRVRSAVVFAVLWLAGRYGLPYLTAYDLFAPYVAILDVALVLAVFKGDVRLS